MNAQKWMIGLLQGYVAWQCVACSVSSNTKVDVPTNSADVIISADPLQGQFSGQAWQYKTAVLSKDLFDKTMAELSFYAFESKDPCSLTGFPTDGADGRIYKVNIKAAVGTYTATDIKEGETIYANFFEFESNGSNNVLSDDFSTTIESVDAKEIKGKLYGRGNLDSGKYFIQGTFTAVNCIK